ncbi:MAG TPA: arylesterase [Gammaproteobacteria bacterium]|nr:arylesterase [Gammaproteobacteria bacterium]
MSRIFSRLFLLLLLSGAAGLALADETILVMGDSLSAAYGMPREAGWVALLEDKLQAGDYDYTVINASISGETTAGALARLPEALKKYHPAIVIIELGGNDGLRGIAITEFRSNLAQLIQQSQATGANVLLTGMRLPANYGPEYTKKFFAVYAELAKKYDIALMPFFLKGVALQPRYTQADGLHPNAQAQPVLLDNIWPYLQPLL